MMVVSSIHGYRLGCPLLPSDLVRVDAISQDDSLRFDSAMRRSLLDVIERSNQRLATLFDTIAILRMRNDIHRVLPYAAQNPLAAFERVHSCRHQVSNSRVRLRRADRSSTSVSLAIENSRLYEPRTEYRNADSFRLKFTPKCLHHSNDSKLRCCIYARRCAVKKTTHRCSCYDMGRHHPIGAEIGQERGAGIYDPHHVGGDRIVPFILAGIADGGHSADASVCAYQVNYAEPLQGLLGDLIHCTAITNVCPDRMERASTVVEVLSGFVQVCLRQ